MPRTMPVTRMQDLAHASRQVFMTKGFRRTQVADIAAEAGLSPAALYRHVEGKEALFHLCFLASTDMARLDGYVSNPTPAVTLELIERRLKTVSRFPRLRAALAAPAPDVRAELGEIITELFRVVSANWELLALVKASASDRPDIHDLYYGRARRRRTDEIARYLGLRIEDGSLRPELDPDVAALMIRETVAWFAWHGKHEPAVVLHDEETLPTLIDVLVAGMASRLPPAPRKTRR